MNFKDFTSVLHRFLPQKKHKSSQICISPTPWATGHSANPQGRPCHPQGGSHHIAPGSPGRSQDLRLVCWVPIVYVDHTHLHLHQHIHIISHNYILCKHIYFIWKSIFQKRHSSLPCMLDILYMTTVGDIRCHSPTTFLNEHFTTEVLTNLCLTGPLLPTQVYKESHSRAKKHQKNVAFHGPVCPPSSTHTEFNRNWGSISYPRCSMYGLFTSIRWKWDTVQGEM